MDMAFRIYFLVLRLQPPDTVKDLSGPDKLYNGDPLGAKEGDFCVYAVAQLLGLQFRDPSLSFVSLS